MYTYVYIYTYIETKYHTHTHTHTPPPPPVHRLPCQGGGGVVSYRSKSTKFREFDTNPAQVKKHVKTRVKKHVIFVDFFRKKLKKASKCGVSFELCREF